MTADEVIEAVLADADLEIGSAEVIRGCQRRRFDVVFLARDSASDLLQSVTRAAQRGGVRIVVVDSRERLGRLARHRRPASAVGARSRTHDPLNFHPDAPADWQLDLLIWFESKRFQHLEGGYKRATLRRGLRRPYSLRLGVVDAATAEVRGLAAIEHVSWLRWQEVPQHAHILEAEYPTQWPELEREMLAVYPSLESDTWMTYYRFNYETIPLSAD